MSELVEPGTNAWVELAASLAPTYVLEGTIGRGGMGTVLLGREVALHRSVAVKVLAPRLAADDGFRRRFDREAQAVARLSHPNIVQIFTAGITAGPLGLPYFIMQFVDGVSLEGWIAEYGPPAEIRARRILHDLAAALATAHARGLVHRDVKPSNVLIERESGRVLLADFGIVAALQPDVLGADAKPEDSGLVLGTPTYMSPEQSLGEPIAASSDVYALGVLGFEVVTGKPPFAGDRATVLRAAHLVSTPQRVDEIRPDVSADLVRLIQRCLEKDARDRPTAADVMREVLPSLDDTLEWPPPGLGLTSLLGRRLTWSARVLVLATAALCVALAAQLPGTHSASGWWNVWRSGAVVVGDNVGSSRGPAAIWPLFVVSCCGTIIAAGLVLSNIVTKLASLSSRARQRGWQRSTLWDVVADPDSRTGALITASGEFVELDSATRREIQRRRRQDWQLTLAAAAVTVLALVAWAASVIAGHPLSPAGGPLVQWLGVCIVVVPALTLLAFSWARSRSAQKQFAGEPTAVTRTGAFVSVNDVRHTDVAAWYAQAGQPAPVLTRAAPAVGFRLLDSMVGACAAATAIALTAGAIATVIVSRTVRWVGPEAARIAAELDRTSPGALLTLPSGNAGMGVEIESASALADLADAGMPYPFDPRAAIGASGGLSRRTIFADAIRRLDKWPPDTMALLRVIAGHPRTRAGRSIPANAVLDETTDPGPLLASIRQAIDANAVAAVLAAAMGDLPTARSRLLANRRAISLVLTGPTRAWSEVGLNIAQSALLLPLIEVERLAGRAGVAEQLVEQEARIAELASQLGPEWTTGTLGLASDTRDTRLFQRAMSDSTIPRGIRNSVANLTEESTCLNARLLLADAAKFLRRVRQCLAIEVR